MGQNAAMSAATSHRAAHAPGLSVIIPVLGEAATINDCLDHVKTLAMASPISGGVECLVVDAEAPHGGETLAALHPRHEDVRGLRAPRGRAAQMNAGAAAARGGSLLFLHADTRLPEGAFVLALEALTRAEAGAFALGFDDPHPLLRLFALLATWRNRLAGTPYGDQAQFFRAETFRELGGYPPLPIMEDVAIMQALRRLPGRRSPGGRRAGRLLAHVPRRVRTSSRRYREQGILRTGLLHNVLRLLHALGVPAHALHRWRKPTRNTA